MAAATHPSLGAEFFLDTRGDARSLRVRWHDRDGLVLLSLNVRSFILRAVDWRARLALVAKGDRT